MTQGSQRADIDHSVAASARVEVWSGTLDLWRRFPVLGTGLGSFESVYPMVESEAVAAVTWEHAHNDWLELLATGGVVAAVVLLVGVAALGRRLCARLLAGRTPDAQAAALAGIGAVLAIGLHELVDFGLTLPANAATLAALVGVASASDADSDSE